MDWSEVGRDVRERRMILYGTQTDLAHAAGVSERSVRKVESGMVVNDRTFARIKDALDRAERERGLVTTNVAGQTIVKQVPPEYWELSDEDRSAIDQMILRLVKREPDD